jgi:hypothetical protein
LIAGQAHQRRALFMINQGRVCDAETGMAELHEVRGKARFGRYDAKINDKRKAQPAPRRRPAPRR